MKTTRCIEQRRAAALVLEIPTQPAAGFGS
jgi:hypothetical protein